MPMDMQPSRGETSSRAQAPQKVNRQAMEIISRLSVERCFIIHFIRSPNRLPMPNTPRLVTMGRSTFDA